MKKLLLFLIFPILALGQSTTGYHRINQVLARGNAGVTAQIVPNATVYVTVTATGLPATIYLDPLLTSPIASASVTSDSNGNYGYYITTNYCVNETISAPQMGSVNLVNICGNSGSISLPVAVPNGGTGATTAAAALTNLGALSKTANLADVNSPSAALANLGGVSLTANSLQALMGPVSLTGVVPFSVVSSAAIGFGANTTSDADWYSLTYGGDGNPAHVWYGVNSANTAFQKLMTLDNLGDLAPQGDVDLTAGNCLYLGGSTIQGVCDDGAGGVSLSTTSGATNGISYYRNGSLQWQMTAAGNFNNANGTVIPGTAISFLGSSSGGPFLVTGLTGTGSTGVLSVSPAFTGIPTAPTNLSCTGSVQIATQQYVANCAGGGSGVTTLTLTTTGSSGPATGSIVGATLTLNIPQYTSSGFHADATISGVGSIAAQACSSVVQINLGSFGSFGTGAYTSIGAQSNYTSTTGWSPIITPITPTIVPDPSLANYVDVKLCNTNPSGGASITPSTFGARIFVSP